MDDILLVAPSNKIDHTLEVFNSLDEHLKFTIEVEIFF